MPAVIEHPQRTLPNAERPSHRRLNLMQRMHPSRERLHHHINGVLAEAFELLERGNRQEPAVD